jgi:hypothetical protein
MGSASAGSSDEPQIPAASTEPPVADVPVPIQQAIQTLARPPVAQPGPVTDSVAGPEAQHMPEAEQVSPSPGAAGPAASSAAVSQAPLSVERAPAEGMPQSLAAQPPVQAASAVTPTGSGTTPAPGPIEQASKPAPAVSQTSQSQQSSDHGAVQAVRSGDPQVERTQCATCGGFHSSLDGAYLHGCLTCGGQNCVPGQKPCNLPANACNTVCGAFLTNLYQEICCPDPCYEPKWDPAAYASFFADYARPRTVTRIRYDNLEDMTRPDRNQFFLNNVNPLSSHRNNRTPIGNLFARLQQVYLYQEAAGERGSFFVEIPYRQINQSWAPTQAGFADINFGIKSLLFDSEMLQLTFQLRTFMPSGNFMNNLGTGQFSLDPSILTSLKLGPETFFQGQFGNWVPLGGPGGNSSIAGGVFYWLMSLNQVLWYTTPDSPLIATLEMDGWSFENGGYTPSIKPNKVLHSPIPDGGGVSYFNIGPGLRQSICNRLDFGGAITWATNDVHWAQPWFRFEVRFLF